jgi:hypothetical protein
VIAHPDLWILLVYSGAYPNETNPPDWWLAGAFANTSEFIALRNRFMAKGGFVIAASYAWSWQAGLRLDDWTLGPMPCADPPSVNGPMHRTMYENLLRAVTMWIDWTNDTELVKERGELGVSYDATEWLEDRGNANQ